MKYQLRWRKAALDQLAQIWLLADSDFRKQITDCCHVLEQSLQKNPLDFGESRDENNRVGFVDRLMIEFRVFQATHQVKIFSIRRI